MKIVLVHNTYREKGGEDVVFESERRLLVRAGHNVIVFVRDNTDLRDNSFADKIAILPRMLWSSNARSEFVSVLDAAQPDLVHIHNTFLSISPSIYSACAERAIPVVQTLHNFRLLCPGGNLFRHGATCHECADHSLFRSVLHGCYRNSVPATASVALMLALHRALNTYGKSVTRFIALTAFAKQQFVSAGFPDGRIVVKPNFAEPDSRERTGAGEYAAYVGRLVGNKGVHVLLDAWKKLRVPYPLHIIGDGPDHLEMEAEARASKLTNVTFRGRLLREEVFEEMQGARFLVVPSTLYEGFPMCIAESFACGTPVLCSKLGALPEIVEHGITGLHFSPGDAQDLASKVEWVWNHPSQLAAMGLAARRKYESDYTSEKNYELLMEIYQQALTARHSEAATATDRRPLSQLESH